MLRFCSLIVLCALAHPVVAQPSGVIRVIDGDTFDVGDIRVRLHAVDAPEADQTCDGPDGAAWDCGAWVSAEVRDRYQGHVAVCEQTDMDRYGRVVARCAVNGQDIGEALVSDGLLLAYRRYGWDYDLAEKAAVVAERGLHGSAFQRPAAFRADQRPKPQVAQDSNCPIKGNLSGNGAIYHVPGQQHYDRTVINTSDGERWFCSESEAVSAGWRPARR